MLLCCGINPSRPVGNRFGAVRGSGHVNMLSAITRSVSPRAKSRWLAFVGIVSLAGVILLTYALTSGTGEMLTRNTVRLSLVWYAAALLLMLRLGPADWSAATAPGKLARWCWTWALRVFPGPRDDGVPLLSRLVACRRAGTNPRDKRVRRGALRQLSVRSRSGSPTPRSGGFGQHGTRLAHHGSTACCTASCCSWLSTAR